MPNDIRKFRIINKIEKNIITNSISEISNKILLALENSKFSLFISFNPISSEDNFPSIYLVPKYMTEFVEDNDKIAKICSAGIFFGFIKKNQFYLSLEAAEFFYEQDLFPKQCQLVANAEGEKAILFGNKILKKNIKLLPPSLKKNEFLIVFNQSNEIISFALSQVDNWINQELNSNEIIAINLVDKGYYLRKKQ